ncbi:MAG TPA: hypothetical protein VLU47_11985, partial [Blastocatellia bacterium]|nr:hypothetical protein [Blastocatellia bacterium]
LQIAEGRVRSHGGLVPEESCEMSGACDTFHVETACLCDIEMWSAERKASWFSEVFQIRTRFELTPAKQVPLNAETATDQTAR